MEEWISMGEKNIKLTIHTIENIVSFVAKGEDFFII